MSVENGLDIHLKSDYSTSQPSEKIRFIRLPEVLTLVGLKKTTLYNLIQQGDFPKPMRIGASSFWTNEDVREWQLKMIMRRDVWNLI